MESSALVGNLFVNLENLSFNVVKIEKKREFQREEEEEKSIERQLDAC